MNITVIVISVFVIIEGILLTYGGYSIITLTLMHYSVINNNASLGLTFILLGGSLFVVGLGNLSAIYGLLNGMSRIRTMTLVLISIGIILQILSATFSNLSTILLGNASGYSIGFSGLFGILNAILIICLLCTGGAREYFGVSNIRVPTDNF